MKFTPRELEGNVNVSSTHPLAELAWLAGGLLFLIAALYTALWGATELAVPRVPVDVEVWAANKLLVENQLRKDDYLSRLLLELVAKVPPSSPLHRYRFSVRVMDSEAVNAMALPGGTIVVYSGLLKEVKTENELAMVLGHELGHYAHRDHLRGLGRGIGLTFLLAMIMGQDSAAADIASDLFLTMEMRYSRKQESSADAFGLELLTARYGHAGGAVDFFSRLAKDSGGRMAYVLASHPHPEDRIAALQRMIAARSYPLGAAKPLEENNWHAVAAHQGNEPAPCE